MHRHNRGSHCNVHSYLMVELDVVVVVCCCWFFSCEVVVLSLPELNFWLILAQYVYMETLVRKRRKLSSCVAGPEMPLHFTLLFHFQQRHHINKHNTHTLWSEYNAHFLASTAWKWLRWFWCILLCATKFRSKSLQPFSIKCGSNGSAHLYWTTVYLYTYTQHTHIRSNK